MQNDQINKMQDLCYKLAHQVPTLTSDEVNYIQYFLHSYVTYMKNYIPETHRKKTLGGNND